MDLAILQLLTGFAGKSAFFDRLMNVFFRIDLFKGMALMCLFWFLWPGTMPNENARVRDQRQNKLIAVLTGSLLIAALSRGLQLTLKLHKRPILSDLHLPFPLGAGEFENLNTWNSFPSDHSMLFFAVSTGLWTINRRVGAIAFVWSLVVIDFPRVYLGSHYPSDVAGGAILGILCMRAFQSLPLERFYTVLSTWRHAYPGVFMAILFFVTDQIGHLLAELRDLAQIAASFIPH